ncbi:laminin subunit gamma-1-like [Hydractinia symbiolongicarpus]|uniref:laminin subunit gamma-1-like n=1 Tax=Hydractinia symbiolongicarpus TaxID=13093 RepID=UPI00254D36DA|nr:laminin subunit gamma-1-like [Hydractinia symbiolongicarpus]
MASFKLFGHPWLLITYIVVLYTTILTNVVSAQCASNIACFSPPIDVAELSSNNITVNSTCGSPAEAFCVNTDCNLNCDATNNETHHPVSFLVDQYDLLTYWKSKNFEEPVYIQFDFGHNLILHQITLTFQFELPNGLYVQRSQNSGKTFLTLAYYAIRCADTFGLPEANFYNKTQVLCFLINPGTIQKQISYAPRRDRYIATEVLKGGAVRDYYLATNIRIVLQEFFTPSDFNRASADRRKFYFTLRDVDVQVACFCNGMSNQCSPQDYGTCICQKNTEGRNCQSCKPLYNNKPWRFGQACEACSCNSHSFLCQYDSSLGFGVCLDCMHNTKGHKCDSCNTAFYRNPSTGITDVNACIACNCNMDGVLFGSSVCNAVTGVCFCKSNVQGATCNVCKDGYFGLSPTILNGCSACACYAFGTVGGTVVCNKTSGLCPCKAGFTGRTCSNCKTGYYGFPVSNPTECRQCGCSPSGSLDGNCDTSGQCNCAARYYGRQCEQVVTGWFSASVNQMIYSASMAVITSPVSWTSMSMNLTDASGNNFFILGYSIGLGGVTSSLATSLAFSVSISAVTYYEFFLQYSTTFSFMGVNMIAEYQSTATSYSCDGGTTTLLTSSSITMTSNLNPNSDSQSFGYKCLAQGQYKVVVWFSPGSAGSSSSSAKIFIMSVLLMPRYQFSMGYIQASVSNQALIRNYYQTASSRSTWALQEAQGAQYLAYLYGYLYTNAVECQCSPVGAINPSVCNTNGGQCNCKKNIYGRTCHSCIPQHYNFTSGLGCVACSCDPNGSINQTCDAITGQCYCKPNVVGRTCNQCDLQYYGLSTGAGCQPCNCPPLYSTSSQCSDDGQCQCKTGVGSAKCTTCAAGYYDLTVTGCKKCSCDAIGTSENRCNPTTGSCTCKSLVMGSRCEQCTVGYYGFSSDFPDTCLKCHCTGKTQECDAADGYYLTDVNTTFPTTVNSRGLSGWKGVDGNGVEAGKISWDWAPEYALLNGFAKLLNDANFPELYFTAPDIFLGDKRSAYMYYLTFDLTQENLTAPIDASTKGDVIIKGKSEIFTLVLQLPAPPLKHQMFRSYRVQFYEKLWKKDKTDGVQPTNAEMIKTLSNLEYIRIRGKWTKEPGHFTGLANIIMQYSDYNLGSTTGLRVAKNVEYCTCPQAYGGQFCQNCNSGYTRSPANGGPYDKCVPCQCNLHSTQCNPNNGLCMNCKDNTEGPSCNQCSFGYYGNATIGEATDCKECLCPGGLDAPNQFAKSCVMDQDRKPTCLSCETGYSGRQCQVCADGYYGNPMDPLGKCKKCICNNNIDPTAPNNCNTTTGECLRCLNNTIGHSCEFCRPGFYGDALTRCNGCSCNLVGADGNECQNITGQCYCKKNVIGRICDKCAENTFNFASNAGCELCQCNDKGSSSLQCNLVTGKCTCKAARIIGDKCDRCAPGFYDLSKGCLPCNCNKEFAVGNSSCDAVTGQCECKRSPLGGTYSGRTCSECDVNAIGTPPNCELCHSPCYDNWQNYIDQEAADIARLHSNVTYLLSKFGGMSYENVQSHLTWLNGNLTYVMDVFSGANYNTTAKEGQFKQIEMHIVEFESVLTQTERQLTSSKQYFETTVANFNGTVTLSASIPQPVPVPQINIRVKRQTLIVPNTVDAAMVTHMAQGYIETTKSNNVSGQAVFTTIKNQFNEIVAANASVADAAVKLSEAMSDLSKSASERARIAGYLDTQYKATFATNAYELKKIHDIVANIMILQNRTVSIHQNALSTLASAQTVITQAKSEAQARLAAAQAVTKTAGEMKVDAVALNASVGQQVKEASRLKATADGVLYDVQRETASLAQGVRDIAVVRNNTANALHLAYEIGNTSMSVTMREIQDLSSQIINTVINEGIINATYEGAQEGLVKAKEVQARSQQALAVSQSTLQDIRNLENAIAESAALRVNATQLQVETDIKVQSVQNITTTIENQFNTISGQGGQTLSLLKTAISQADANKMCFVNAKAIVDNATAVAEEARKKSQEALLLHQSNAGILPSYSTQINSLYQQTSATHTKAQQAATDAQQLLEDVTEAERLLSQFTAQQNELNSLKSETETLEAELNDLLLKYEQERVKFSGCSRP